MGMYVIAAMINSAPVIFFSLKKKKRPGLYSAFLVRISAVAHSQSGFLGGKTNLLGLVN